jgi:hypothetical protein
VARSLARSRDRGLAHALHSTCAARRSR